MKRGLRSQIKPMEIDFGTDEEAQAFHDWATGVITGDEYDNIREKFGYKKTNNKKDIVEVLRAYRKFKKNGE